MRNLLFILLAIFTVQNTYAQDVAERGRITAFVPHSMILGGTRIDYDFQLKNSNKWIQLSPQIYYRENADRYDQMWGAGLFLSQRLYFNSSKQPLTTYLKYGLEYNYFNFEYTGDAWVTTNWNGMEVLEEKTLDIVQNIHRGGVNAAIGFQTEFVDSPVLLDLYLGIFFRKSFLQSEVETKEEFNNGLWDYGYNGTGILAGLRIGVMLDQIK